MRTGRTGEGKSEDLCTFAQVMEKIDFGKTEVRKLFFKLLIPTLLSQVLLAALNVVDGIVVGRGIGSDALAAVNIASPVFLIASSIALLFATGVSILAAIELAKGRDREANYIVTQSVIISSAIMAAFALAVFLLSDKIGYLFGGTDKLQPYVVDYLLWVCPAMLFITVSMVAEFIIRLDGSPKYALCCNLVSTAVNITLDILFVIVFKWGMKGAAAATSLATFSSAVMSIIYLCLLTDRIHLLAPELTRGAVRRAAKNCFDMVKAGVSSFIGELAINVMIIAGNFMFIKCLGEDGVAAFSVCCYLTPIVFMFGNSIAQAQIPIISYNFGSGEESRIRRTLKLSLTAGAGFGIAMTVLGVIFSGPIASLFLDRSGEPFAIAAYGLPRFSVSMIIVTLNLILIGYFQSIKRTAASVAYMMLRGLVFLIPSFVLLPSALGVDGLWFAVPLSEGLTLAAILLHLYLKK